MISLRNNYFTSDCTLYRPKESDLVRKLITTVFRRHSNVSRYVTSEISELAVNV